MSYSAPGPERSDTWLSRFRRPTPPIERVASAGPRKHKDLIALALPRPLSDPAWSVGAGEPPIEYLLELEAVRRAALAAEDADLARAALQKVVTDLDFLLGSAAAYLDHEPTARERRSLKKLLQRDAAVSTLLAMPLHRVADLLGLPEEHVQSVRTALRDRGGLEAELRREALMEIRRLRAQLRVLARTENHDLLGPIVGFVVSIIEALFIATSATVIGTLAVGDSIDWATVFQTGVVSLVTLALQTTTVTIRRRRAAGAPRGILRDRLEELATALSDTRSDPTSLTFQVSIDRVQLLVTGYRARLALIDITSWAGAPQCRNLLREVTAGAEGNRDFDPDRLQRQFRRLARSVPD